jgi:mxaA protein
LIALIYLGYARGVLALGRPGRYFREARRELQRLRAEGESPAVLRAGFTCVHRAFDRTLGEPLFAERLPEFFAGHTGYAPLRGEIEGFFQCSYTLFFGGKREKNPCLNSPYPSPLPEGEGARGGECQKYDLARLESLCVACLKVERNRP